MQSSVCLRCRRPSPPPPPPPPPLPPPPPPCRHSLCYRQPSLRLSPSWRPGFFFTALPTSITASVPYSPCDRRKQTALSFLLFVVLPALPTGTRCCWPSLPLGLRLVKRTHMAISRRFIGPCAVYSSGCSRSLYTTSSIYATYSGQHSSRPFHQHDTADGKSRTAVDEIINREEASRSPSLMSLRNFGDPIPSIL